MILVIVSNSVTCRIYQYQYAHHHPNDIDKVYPQLIRLKEINHPENKLKISELVADRSGHYDASPSNQGSYSPPHNPKEVVIDHFIQEIAKILHHERNQNDYKKCIMVASPRITGLLSQHLNSQDQAFIIQTIQKDMIHLPDHELIEFLKMNIDNSHLT